MCNRRARRLALAVLALSAAAPAATAQTAFTYQGELKDGASLPTGSYDFRFLLFDAPSGGAQLGATLCADNVAVASGRFLTELDFGAQFSGPPRYLEIQVRQDTGLTCASTAGYTTLSRQKLTPAPQAAFASTAGSASTATTAATATNATQLNGQAASFYTNAANLTGTLPSTALSGTYSGAISLTNAANAFSGSGAGLINLNAGNVSTGTLADARLSTAVALLNAAQTNTAAKTFANNTLLLRNSANTFSTTLSAPSSTASRAVSLPDASGTVITTGNTTALTASGAFAAGDLLYASSPSALSRRAIGAPATFLRSDGSLPAWAALTSADLPSPFFISRPNDTAISGETTTGIGLYGRSNSTGAAIGSYGVLAEALGSSNAALRAHAMAGLNSTSRAVEAIAEGGSGTAVYAEAVHADGATYGVRALARSSAGIAIRADADATSGLTIGLLGRSASLGNGIGILGISNTVYSSPILPGGIGILGYSRGAAGVAAIADGTTGSALWAIQQSSTGSNSAIRAETVSPSATAIYATAESTGTAIRGESASNDAIVATTATSGKSSFFGYTGTAGANGGYFNSAASTGAGKGVVGQCNSPAGYGVYSLGNTAATGTKSFQIDHPLDPAHKFLNHYSAEGPEPLNIYSGTVTLDGSGEAWVTLPDYFESINADARYQLTPVGGPAPMLHIASRIADRRFMIAGGTPGLEVSWEVKARRNDAWVRAHGAPVEIQKSPADDGRYLHPDLYSQPASAALSNPAPAPAPAPLPRPQPLPAAGDQPKN